MNIVERTQIIGGFVPLDLQVARSAQYVELPDRYHATIILFKGLGTDGDDPIITLQQASTITGTGVKALNFSRIWRKQATDVLTVPVFTLTTQTPASTYTNTDGHQQAIWVLEVEAADLDKAGGFNFIRVIINDTGVNAQLGSVLYIIGPPDLDPPPTLRALRHMMESLLSKYIPT